jgi:hypothetical protein
VSFDEFWAAYPRRAPHANPKAPAAKKYAAAIRAGAKADEIIAGAAGYGVAVSDEDPRYICQAITFLRQERWRDYLPTEEELAAEQQAKADAMTAMGAAVKRGENLSFLDPATLDALIEGGYVTAEQARGAGYKVA